MKGRSLTGSTVPARQAGHASVAVVELGEHPDESRFRTGHLVQEPLESLVGAVGRQPKSNSVRSESSTFARSTGMEGEATSKS